MWRRQSPKRCIRIRGLALSRSGSVPTAQKNNLSDATIRRGAMKIPRWLLLGLRVPLQRGLFRLCRPVCKNRVEFLPLRIFGVFTLSSAWRCYHREIAASVRFTFPVNGLKLSEGFGQSHGRALRLSGHRFRLRGFVFRRFRGCQFLCHRACVRCW